MASKSIKIGKIRERSPIYLFLPALWWFFWKDFLPAFLLLNALEFFLTSCGKNCFMHPLYILSK